MYSKTSRTASDAAVLLVTNTVVFLICGISKVEEKAIVENDTKEKYTLSSRPPLTIKGITNTDEYTILQINGH